MRDPWICPDCGSIATGDLCVACGSKVPHPWGEYYELTSPAFLIGWPSYSLKTRIHWSLLIGYSLILLSLVVVQPEVGLWLAVIYGTLALRALVWGRLKRFAIGRYAKYRFRA